MKFLFIPGNNSLSHAAKCLAVGEKLILKGHECLIAVTKANSEFLDAQGFEHVILPDIQETDRAGFPSIVWFRDKTKIIECIKAEADLIKTYRPHRVIGVFRFTLKASSRIADTPYDSLICGCMTPHSKGVLGFAHNAPDLEFQKNHINMFFRSAGIKLSSVLSGLGLEKINDIREVLMGDRTFLWDFPEFNPVDDKDGLVHLGPLSWNKWPYDPIDEESIRNSGAPLAVISFGTCAANIAITERLIKILTDMGHRVIVAGGGMIGPESVKKNGKNVLTCRFAPLEKILPQASLIICHGGQMTVFEALLNRVPVVVLPFQPEQAHNGICLERLGCGRLLVPSRTFVGNSKIYTDALDAMTDGDIISIIRGLVGNPETTKHLHHISGLISGYNGAESLASFLEQRP